MNLIQRYQRLKPELVKRGQDHVLQYWDELDDSSRDSLLKQLENVDQDLLERLAKLEPYAGSAVTGMSPAPVIRLAGSAGERAAAEKARQAGIAALRAGKVGVFLVAGGQGSRLGYDGPKGCYPIGPVSGKSIFQMHAEKILAAARRYRTVIPWYIMTSETNDALTRSYFETNHFFGLNTDDVKFFRQRMQPALDVRGKLILDAKDHVFASPNGHGGALQALVENGAVDDMKKRGIEAISYFQVDNVLIKIIDPLFIGYHFLADSEMSSKMLRKRSPFEKLGHFGLVNGKLCVIEYSDMRKEDVLSKNSDGSYKYEAGSPAIHMINPDFVLKEMEGGLRLPYHKALKQIPCLDENGNPVTPERPNGFKFETFIFDALQDTKRSVIVEAVREHEFSPVKNKTGEDSPETARRDLSDYFGEWLEAVGSRLPRDADGHVQGVIEISPVYADSIDEFVEKEPGPLVFSGSFLR